jgi:hypothetical protein
MGSVPNPSPIFHHATMALMWKGLKREREMNLDPTTSSLFARKKRNRKETIITRS